GAIDRLQTTAGGTGNVMEATGALAEAGGAVGEWAGALREVFGEFRAPIGVGGVVSPDAEAMAAVRETVRAIVATGGPPKLLVGKPGLDGHSHRAEQLAVAAPDPRMPVVHSAIRLTPAQLPQ